MQITKKLIRFPHIIRIWIVYYYDVESIYDLQCEFLVRDGTWSFVI